VVAAYPPFQIKKAGEQEGAVIYREDELRQADKSAVSGKKKEYPLKKGYT